ITALEIGVVGFGIHAPAVLKAREARAFREVQRHIDLARDRLRNLRLYAKHVAEVALVSLGPHLGLVLDFTKTRGDPHSIAAATRFALKNVIHAKVLVQLPERLCG